MFDGYFNCIVFSKRIRSKTAIYSYVVKRTTYVYIRTDTEIYLSHATFERKRSNVAGFLAWRIPFHTAY